MSERSKAFVECKRLCQKYAFSLPREKYEWAMVALECAAIIEDVGKRVLTIDEIGNGSCQELSSFLVAPEIDYTSGFPSK